MNNFHLQELPVMNRNLIYQSYQEMLSSIRVQCYCQKIWYQYIYKIWLFCLNCTRRNVKFKNVASAKFQ